MRNTHIKNLSMYKLVAVFIPILGLTIAVVLHVRRLPVQLGKETQERNLEPFGKSSSPVSPSVRPKAQSPANKTIALPDWESDSAVKKLLAKSAPDARTLFEKGLGCLRRGAFLEAFSAFDAVTSKYPEDSARPLAEWAIPLVFYREGGPGHLLFAAEHFNEFCDRHSGSDELNFLVQAAKIDKTVIERELMEFVPTELDSMPDIKDENPKVTYQMVVETFLREYPNSPYVKNAQEVLAKIREFSNRKLTGRLSEECALATRSRTYS